MGGWHFLALMLPGHVLHALNREETEYSPGGVCRAS